MTESKSFNRVATIILTFLVIVTLLPIVLLVIASFTKEQVLVQNGYTFFPKALSLDAYYYMVKQGAVIVRSYGVSFLVTVLGTVMSVVVTTTLAYPMARKSFRYKNVLSFFVFFTMLFNGGIVPSYIMWSRFFHIKNTLWALIIPNYMVTAFNVILVKTFYSIMFPLSRPVVATISLFTGLCYWNDWTNGLYYVDNEKLFSIQLLLMKIMNNIQALKANTALMGTGTVELPGTSVRMAMAFVGILPILIVYPFVQKYLVEGVVIGAVKG